MRMRAQFAAAIIALAVTILLCFSCEKPEQLGNQYWSTWIEIRVENSEDSAVVIGAVTFLNFTTEQQDDEFWNQAGVTNASGRVDIGITDMGQPPDSIGCAAVAEEYSADTVWTVPSVSIWWYDGPLDQSFSHFTDTTTIQVALTPLP
jgi:hypothetical protein